MAKYICTIIFKPESAKLTENVLFVSVCKMAVMRDC